MVDCLKAAKCKHKSINQSKPKERIRTLELLEMQRQKSEYREREFSKNDSSTFFYPEIMMRKSRRKRIVYQILSNENFSQAFKSDTKTNLCFQDLVDVFQSDEFSPILFTSEISFPVHTTVCVANWKNKRSHVLQHTRMYSQRKKVPLCEDTLKDLREGNRKNQLKWFFWKKSTTKLSNRPFPNSMT